VYIRLEQQEHSPIRRNGQTDGQVQLKVKHRLLFPFGVL
jgi:hypothetical protein